MLPVSLAVLVSAVAASYLAITLYDRKKEKMLKIKGVPPVVYVAGPFRADTPWGVEKNVRKAEQYALYLWGLGIPNICPHTQGRFFDKEIPDEIILLGMKQLLRKCEAVLVIGRWQRSEGTKAEIADAEIHGIPVFFEIAKLVEWASSRN